MKEFTKNKIDLLKAYLRLHNYRVFFVFFFISSFFWLLTKYSKIYTSKVDYVVVYKNLPQNLSWNVKKETSVMITTKTDGFTLLNYKILGKNIELDLSYLSNLKDEEYFLIPQYQLTEIIDQFPSDVDLIFQKTDTIFFDFSKVISKKIPVFIKKDITLEESYKFISDLNSTPDSVTIKGPKSLISSIDSIGTKLISIKKLDKSLKVTIGLESFNDSKISVSKSVVNILCDVEKFTQSEIDIQIFVENVPTGYIMKVFPSNAKVIYNVGLSNYKKVSNNSFRLTADFNKSNNKNQEIPLNLEVKDSIIDLIRFEPSDVEFILRKIK